MKNRLPRGAILFFSAALAWGCSGQRPSGLGANSEPLNLLPAINPSPTINTFVAYASNTITLGTGVRSLGGDMGVATANGPAPQLSVGSQDLLDGLYNLYAPSVTPSSATSRRTLSRTRAAPSTIRRPIRPPRCPRFHESSRGRPVRRT